MVRPCFKGLYCAFPGGLEMCNRPMYQLYSIYFQKSSVYVVHIACEQPWHNKDHHQSHHVWPIVSTYTSWNKETKGMLASLNVICMWIAVVLYMVYFGAQDMPYGAFRGYLKCIIWGVVRSKIRSDKNHLVDRSVREKCIKIQCIGHGRPQWNVYNYMPW